MVQSFSLDNKCIKICLFGVVPGKESEVEKKLYEIMKNFEGYFAIVRVLGKYDIVLIHESIGFGHDLLFEGYVEDMTNHNQIVCYQWIFKHEEESNQWISLLNNNYLCISCIKIDSQYNQTFGLEIEKQISNCLLNKQPKAKLLCTLGWNEIVWIQYSNLISELITETLELDELEFEISQNDEKESFKLNDICITLLSIIGIGSSLLKDIKNNKESSQDTIDIETGFPVLTICCKNEYWNSIQQDVLKLYEEMCGNKTKISYLLETLSSSDYTVEIKSGNWADFFNFLLEFRERFREKIISTKVSIARIFKTKNHFDHIFKNNALKQKDNKLAPALIDKSEAIKIRRIWGENLGSQFLHMIYSFNHYYNNILLHETLRDMVDATFLLKEYSLTQDDTKDSYGFEEQIHSFKDGVVQRCVGVVLFLENLELSFTSTPTWVQRIIGAQSYAIKTTLNLLGINWSGFIVIGNTAIFLQRYLSIHCPEDLGYLPDKWIGITHEVMHLVFQEDCSILDIDHPIIEFLLNRTLSVRHDYEKLELFNEVGCEILDYYITYLKDITESIKTVWSYFADYYPNFSWTKKEYYFHFLRTLILKVYHEKYTNKSITSHDKGYIIRTINEINEQILVLFCSKVDNGDRQSEIRGFYKLNEDEIDGLYRDFESISLIIVYYNEKFETPKMNGLIEDMHKYYISDEFELIVSDLLKGIIPDNELKFPHLLLKKIREHDMSFKSRLAVILLLWQKNESKNISNKCKNYQLFGEQNNL